MLDVLSRVLDLCTSRAEVAEFLDLCAAPPVARRFGFGDESSIERIGVMLRGAGTRWGIDSTTRQRFGVGVLSQNTWQAGLNRLLLGVTMSERDLVSIGTAIPYDLVESQDVWLLGSLAELAGRLREAVDLFGTPASPLEWSARFRTVVLGRPDPDAGVVGGAGVGRVASLDPDALEAWRGSEWAAARRAIARRERSFAEFLSSAGLVARTDLLGYYARWVTPEIEPRRYVTHFFTAMMPTGQRADAATSEAQSAGWVVPAAMLAAATTGTALLMPPTVIALEAVAGATQAAELVGRRERVPLIRTIPARTPTGWVMQAVIP